MLRKCLRSLCEQTLKPKQIVIVDQGCTDQCGEVWTGPVADATDLGISVVRLPHGERNVHTAREAGYGWIRVHGHEPQFMLFCDQDIEWNVDALQKLERALVYADQTKVAYAYGGYRRRGALNGVVPPEQFSEVTLRDRNFVSTMSLIRMDILRQLAPPVWDADMQLLEDWALWLRLLNNGWIGTVVRDHLFTATYYPGDRSTHHQAYWDWKAQVQSKYVKGNAK